MKVWFKLKITQAYANNVEVMDCVIHNKSLMFVFIISCNLSDTFEISQNKFISMNVYFQRMLRLSRICLFTVKKIVVVVDILLKNPSIINNSSRKYFENLKSRSQIL